MSEIKNTRPHDLSFTLSREDGRAWPILFPYSVIAALNCMTSVEARLFLYCCRLINGFEGRESKIVSISTLSRAIGAGRKQTGRALDKLSCSTNRDGSLRQAFLTKIDRGQKKPFEIRIAFPGCMPGDIRSVSPGSIESHMFSVPAVFFDGDEDGIQTPIKEWSLTDIQVFYRICAMQNQKEFGEVSLREMCQHPQRLKTAILPTINQRISRVSPSLRLMQELGLVTILDRIQNDDYLFRVMRPEIRDYSMSEPKSTHVRPESTHVRPESTHVTECGIKPKSAHVRPESAHVRPESAHVRPESSLVKPESTHYESVVVVSLKNTTTEPTNVTETFAIKIAETDDVIQCSLSEAIDFAIENTSQEIEDRGRYAGGLRKKIANGIVIKGDGSIYFDIATYVRSKINDMMNKKSGKIRQQLNTTIKSGHLPFITPKKGKPCFVQKITENLLVLTLEANPESPSKKTLYGNDVSLYLLGIQKIEEGELARPPSTIERIKAALDKGKQVDLFSKKQPRIDIVDSVGSALISVTDGEKGELDEDELMKLQKPAILKGPGYQLRINGRFLDSNQHNKGRAGGGG